MGSCAAPSAKGDDKFITTDYLQQCPIKSGVKLKLVWLERGHTKADIVADVLATAGFPDFGDQLKLLATSSLQKTHKLA
ncbi:hypothetical protein ACUDAA_25265 [Escherichia coli]|uniref:hypothetical protein n=1 Tax=Escherichia coli TaxID=562 RepID=UPI00403D1010